MPMIMEAIKILEIPFEVTKKIQKPDFTLSEFYGACIKMREMLKFFAGKQDKKSNLAKCLLSEYDGRRSKMLRNQAMLAAVYLDRRFGADLDADEIELSKLTLCSIWEQVKSIRAPNENTHVHQESIDDTNREVEFDFASYFAMKGFVTTDIGQCDQATSNNIERSSDKDISPNYKMTKSEFLISLDSFERKFPIINHTIPVFTFWEEQKQNFPEIFEVSNILFAIPPSQATVERSFSQFGFVFNSRRCKIASETLEDILLIKLNKNISYEVFRRDLEKLQGEFEQTEQ